MKTLGSQSPVQTCCFCFLGMCQACPKVCRTDKGAPLHLRAHQGQSGHLGSILKEGRKKGGKVSETGEKKMGREEARKEEGRGRRRQDNSCLSRQPGGGAADILTSPLDFLLLLLTPCSLLLVSTPLLLSCFYTSGAHAWTVLHPHPEHVRCPHPLKTSSHHSQESS